LRDRKSKSSFRRIVLNQRHAQRTVCATGNTMGAPATQWSISDTDESLELQTMGGTLRFGSKTALRHHLESTAAKTPREGLRVVGRSNKPLNDAAEPAPQACDDNRLGNAAEVVAEPCDDILAAGATSIADIDKLIGELQAARDYLQAEGERVRRLIDRYAQLAQTASASTKIIADSIGEWHNPERLSPAPSLSSSP
jgi:hypothetical protein